jgi:hypothetical protein
MIIAPRGIATLLGTDARCRALAWGLRQLSVEELWRVCITLDDNPASVVTDSCNFDPDTGAWCPLAIGLGVPDIAAAGGGVNSDAEGKRLILEVGRLRHGEFSLNPMSGVPGSFFRGDRRADLKALTHQILDESREQTESRQARGWRLTVPSAGQPTVAPG